MPAALGYLMFLGIVACQMSTVDTFANVTALALSNDILAQRGEGGRKVGRVVSVAVLGAAVLYAILADRLGDVYYISSGVLSAAIAIPLFGYGWKRLGPAAIWSSGAVGFVSAIGFYWLEYKVWGLTAPASMTFLTSSMGYNYLGACVLASLVTLVAVGLAAPADKRVQMPVAAAEAE